MNLDTDEPAIAKLVQTGLNTLANTKLEPDGVFGDKTRRALTDYLLTVKRLTSTTEELTGPVGKEIVLSKFNHWPKESDAESFFGYPPTLTVLQCPYPMRINDCGWKSVMKFSCNVKVAESLHRILSAILAHYGSPSAIQAIGLDVFDGCYNDRNVRGSSTKKSMHAFGAAIDLDAEHNPLGSDHGRMPPEVVAIFKREGWRWGGDYTGRKDPMHMEACR